MNTAQRKFLIERIQKKATEKIKELENQLQDVPSASNFIFKALLNDELALKPQEVILDALKQKAMKAKEGSNWLSEEWMSITKNTTVKIELKSLIELPEDYYAELERVRLHNHAIEKEIAELKIQKDSIEVRIQLASDKTLQKLINDVDDMGDIRLIDTNLKQISA